MHVGARSTVAAKEALPNDSVIKLCLDNLASSLRKSS